MLQKIMLNISLEINNVVIKYCTERYTSSISWKSLSVMPTNPDWKPAFCDYHGQTKASYKVVKLVDATWCLDSVSPESGKIVTFEAPLFNRESVAVRILQRAGTQDVHRGWEGDLPAVQIHLKLDDVCFSVSDKQLEMLVRKNTRNDKDIL